MNDSQLLQQWVGSNDRRAGNELFERYFRQIQAYFMNAVGDQERMDLAQETFLRLTKSASGFAGKSSFRTYLFGIAHNVLRDHLRRQKRTFDPLVDTTEDLEGQTPSREVSLVLRRNRILAHIRALPFESQELLELYYWHGMTAPDCAQILGVKPGTIRRRVHEIRHTLVSKMREDEDSDAPNPDLARQLTAIAKVLFVDSR